MWCRVCVVVVVAVLTAAFPQHRQVTDQNHALLSVGFQSSLDSNNSSKIRLVKDSILSLKDAVVQQGAVYRERSEAALRSAAAEIHQLDNTIADLVAQKQTVSVEVEGSKQRLSALTNQLFGSETPPIASDGLLESLTLDSADGGPEILPLASGNSVLHVMSIVSQQHSRLRGHCSADSPAHATRASSRLDVEALNYVISDVAAGLHPFDKTSGCPFCNSTACRMIENNCILETSEGLPSVPHPDTAKCWHSIDSYCDQLPGSKDPGCSCRASERCWTSGPFIGHCPVVTNQTRHCDSLPLPDCWQYQHSDANQLYTSPTLSSADEALVSGLRDLRREILESTTTENSVATTLPHCESDLAALAAHFQKLEGVAVSLLRKRQEVTTDLHALAAVLESKEEMISSGKENRAALLKRTAVITQQMTERHTELAEELRSLDQALGLLGSFVSSPATSKASQSRETAMVSCMALKKMDPSLPSGVYWVTLGMSQAEAVRVYCDMVSDGGGWTLVWKNVGGAVDPAAKSSQISNQQLFSSSRDDIVSPPLVDRKALFNSQAFNYFAARPNMEWMKSMSLFRGKTDRVAAQRVRLELGQNRMFDVFHAPDGCSALPEAIKVYSTLSDAGTDGTTTYYMGETKSVVNKLGRSYGLANSGSPQDACLSDVNGVTEESLARRCSASAGTRLQNSVEDPLVCDFQMLRRLSPTGNLTVAGTWEAIRHIFSYVHDSTTARDPTRCMFRCWEPEDDHQYNDVFVWQVRPKCPVSVGLECSGNGRCDEGFCHCQLGYSGNACETRISCGEPNKPNSNAPSVNCDGYLFGDMCSLSCSAGFQNVGEDSIKCLATGKWSQAIQSCGVEECSRFETTTEKMGAPTTISCESGVGVSTVGQTCHVTCDEGFRHVGGSGTVTCSAGGEWLWDTPSPGCVKVVCEEPKIPENGTRSCDGPLADYNTRCEFGCLAGRVQHGSVTRVCGPDGRYSGTPASCHGRVCEGFVGKPNMLVECSARNAALAGHSLGETCNITCESNYRLEGSNSVQCMEDGSWLQKGGNDPECVVIDACVGVVCGGGLPSCPAGFFIAEKQNWNDCCFNQDTDCVQFEHFVTATISMKASLSEATSTGVRNTNKVKGAIAELSGVEVSRVILFLLETGPTNTSANTFAFAVLPSSTGGTELDTIVQKLTQALIVEPNNWLSKLEHHALSVAAFSLIAPPTKAARVPMLTAKSLLFVDTDGRQGWVTGSASIHKSIPSDPAAFEYVLYFGDGQGDKLANRVGDFVVKAPINRMIDSPFVSVEIPTTKVPEGAMEWLVFGKGPFAEASQGLRAPLQFLELKGANLTSGSLQFTDEDSRQGWIRGTATVTTPSQARLNGLALYFGNGNTSQDGKVGARIGQALTTGETTTIPIDISLPLPQGASHFVVFGLDGNVEGDIGLTESFNHAFSNNKHN